LRRGRADVDNECPGDSDRRANVERAFGGGECGPGRERHAGG
jgi:hypothetical protein